MQKVRAPNFVKQTTYHVKVQTAKAIDQLDRVAPAEEHSIPGKFWQDPHVQILLLARLEVDAVVARLELAHLQPAWTKSGTQKNRVVIIYYIVSIRYF